MEIRKIVYINTIELVDKVKYFMKMTLMQTNLEKTKFFQAFAFIFINISLSTV